MVGVTGEVVESFGVVLVRFGGNLVAGVRGCKVGDGEVVAECISELVLLSLSLL